MSERWRPSVTVAAVIEEQGRFLLVEEHTPEGLKLNNPAGHLEPGETPLEAVVREVMEETGCVFAPDALLGVYLARFVRPPAGVGAGAGADAGADEDITYLRFAYSGRVGAPVPGHALDAAIVRTLWLTREEIAAARERHRSPLLMRCIDDHLAGRRFALDAVVGHDSLRAPMRLVLQAAPAMAGATMRAMSETPNEMAPVAPPTLLADATPNAAALVAGAVSAPEAADAPSGPTAVDAADASNTPAAAVAAETPSGPAATDATDASDASAAAGAAEASTASKAAGASDEAGATSASDAVAAESGTDAAAQPAEPPSRKQGAPDSRAEPTWGETAARLAELFPALFTPGAFKPIKLRVQADIQQRAPGQFTKKQLSIFLHRHTTSTAYIRALVVSTQRFDLDGQPAGEVAGVHLEAAKEELERRRQIMMQRRAAGRGAAAAHTGGARVESASGPATADAGEAVEARASRPRRPRDGAGAPHGGERGARGRAHDRPPYPVQDRTSQSAQIPPQEGMPNDLERPAGEPQPAAGAHEHLPGPLGHRHERHPHRPQGRSNVGPNERPRQQRSADRPQGPQGMRGPHDPQSGRGPQGPQGPQGAPGPQGPQSAQSRQGPQSAQGPRGAEGSRERPRGAPHDRARAGPHDRPHGSPDDRPHGRPHDRPHGRPHDRPTHASLDGRRGGPSGPPGARAPAARHEPVRGGAPSPASATGPAWPDDPARRERSQLLRSFEGSPLTAANFSALKGMALPQFEAQIALARNERDERHRGAPAPRAVATGKAPAGASPSGAVGAVGAVGVVGVASGAASERGAALADDANKVPAAVEPLVPPPGGAAEATNAGGPGSG